MILEFGGVEFRVQAAESGSTGTMKDMERDLIIKTLRETGGNRTKAAQLLGISVRTIRNKIKEYGITDEVVKGLSS